MSDSPLSSPESNETLMCLPEFNELGIGMYSLHKAHALVYMCMYTYIQIHMN